MSKEENVINYYILCNKLKDTIRTGWLTWNVNRKRVESVAEHIFGVQMLAIAINSEYEYDIDIKKVIYMLAIHELGEAIIGDLTLFQITDKEKFKIEYEAVKEVLGSLIDKEYIEELFLEFESKQTKESLFAYQCDKLECDLQCKIYDEEHCVDKSYSNESLENEEIKHMLDSGASWSEMWLKFGQSRYPYDKNFRAISDYALNNKILRKRSTITKK